MSIAEVKRGVARAEKVLAEWRAKEASLLYELQCITRDVAEKRLSQADINIERTKSFQKHFSDKPRLVVGPQDLFSTLSTASISLGDSMRVA